MSMLILQHSTMHKPASATGRPFVGRTRRQAFVAAYRLQSSVGSFHLSLSVAAPKSSGTRPRYFQFHFFVP